VRAIAAILVLLAVAGLYAQSRRRASNSNSGRKWAMYEGEMQDPVDDPADADLKGEFVFARLRYRSPRDGGWYSRWGIDCNKSDRLFLQCVRRLTRIDAQSVEEIVDIESDDVFNYPWLFAVSPGDWVLTPSQAARLRQYFDRGGFLMVDDFHGERDWGNFMRGIRQIDPEAQAVELENADAIFHVLYDLTNRVQIPGANVVHGPGYEKDGVIPHWRAILDRNGRVMVAICFNMDVGDAWEFADSPEYPEKFASQAIRLGLNYVLYPLTH
jgi:hypothetical protein